MLTTSEARDVLRLMVRAAGTASRDAWESGTAFLLGCDGRTWLDLDDEARRWHVAAHDPPPVRDPGLGSGPWFPDGAAEWPGDAGAFRAVLASMHTDGRIRQAATEVLSTQPGTLRTVALAVRTGDHVPGVRRAALNGLERQLARAGDDRILDALGVVVAAGARRPGPAVLAQVTATLFDASDPGDARLRRLLDRSTAAVRRWLFVLAHDRGLPSVPELVEIVATDRDPRLRALCAAWLEADAPAEDLASLLDSRFADARGLALRRLDDAGLPDALLLPLLADRSSRVRELARWRAERRGADPAAWYRRALDPIRAAGPAQLSACLSGLAATGSPGDVPVLERFLGHPAPRVRTAAVTGLGAARIIPAPGSQHPQELARVDAGVRALVRPLLLDPSPRVAQAAASTLARRDAPPPDADEALRSDQVWSRKAALRVLRTRSGWPRFTADLRAAADPDPVLAHQGRIRLLSPAQYVRRATWSPPSPADQALIEELLPRAGLTDAERQRLGSYLRR